MRCSNASINHYDNVELITLTHVPLESHMPLQLDELLSRGYFPAELPPPFTTEGYSLALTGAGAARPNNSFEGTPKFAQPCDHNLVRAGGLRRNLSIPNPKHFYRLARHIVQHWVDLEVCASHSPFSATKPTLGGPRRAITPLTDLAQRPFMRAQARATARFALVTDISRFFPSIYTHSIPWAIMGKANAKAAHAAGRLRGSWEDDLDTLSRSVNSNQTIGIPIGPDTSRLLAEVVLAPVDAAMAAKFPNMTGFRFIDDYELFFEQRSDAECALGHLQYLLNDYGLAINGTKTQIIELPHELDCPATTSLRVFPFRDAGVRGQKHDLTSYFNSVFQYIKKYPEDGSIKYAIARLNGVDIERENWAYMQDILANCVSVEPACISQICNQVVHYMGLSYSVSLEMWRRCLNQVVIERVPLGHASEAAWAMWMMKVLGVRLASESARAVSATEDSVVALMALGLASQGLADHSELSGLDQFAGAGLDQGQWLLTYQGNLMGWFGAKGPKNHLSSDPAFEYLANQGVSFFDISVPVPVPDRHDSSAPGGGGGGGGGAGY